MADFTSPWQAGCLSDLYLLWTVWAGCQHLTASIPWALCVSLCLWLRAFPVPVAPVQGEHGNRTALGVDLQGSGQ